uniref:Uncharacterized protein n=1 Tax=Sphaerodactylus townsendi TaxID=933632 RepID=A0ACB8ETR8_9SAUR
MLGTVRQARGRSWKGVAVGAYVGSQRKFIAAEACFWSLQRQRGKKWTASKIHAVGLKAGREKEASRKVE